jgi:hypothetical protein
VAWHTSETGAKADDNAFDFPMSTLGSVVFEPLLCWWIEHARSRRNGTMFVMSDQAPPSSASPERTSTSVLLNGDGDSPALLTELVASIFQEVNDPDGCTLACDGVDRSGEVGGYEDASRYLDVKSGSIFLPPDMPVRSDEELSSPVCADSRVNGTKERSGCSWKGWTQIASVV